MLRHGAEHVPEAAEEVRADRLALIGAGHRPDEKARARNGEMIRPERGQPLDERCLAAQHGEGAGVDLVARALREAVTERRHDRLLPATPRRQEARHAVAGRRQGGDLGRNFRPRRDLRLEPAARIAPDRGQFARPRPEAEAVGGNKSVGCGSHDPLAAVSGWFGQYTPCEQNSVAVLKI